jgi:hypothetical protein
VLEHGLDVLAGDAGEPLEEVVNACAIFKVLKE